MIKTCKDCGEEKPLEAFHRHPQMRDGRINQCRVCRGAWLASYRKRVGRTDKYRAPLHIERLRNSQRRARLKENVCDCCSSEDLRQVYEFASFLHEFEVDHIIPVSKGGKHCVENLRPVPRAYNRAKADKVDTK